MKRTSGNSFREVEDWDHAVPYLPPHAAPLALFMIYWIHIARSIDRVTLHKDRCSEVPSVHSSSDFWEGGWFDYPDKQRALAAMEQAGTTEQRRCPLCRP